MPEITVLMPAYNCGQYIAKAVESVLNQTFTDFELIILDDGSTDCTLFEIERFQDPRIVVVKNKHDFIETLNIGLEKVTGRYLARMDADDLIPVNRLAMQYAILEEHPDIDVCSGWMQTFGENVNQELLRVSSGYIKQPLLLMLQANFVYNATTMCRTSFIHEQGLKYKHYPYAEDFMFWCEAARAGARFFVESQIIYYYRMWENQVGRKYRAEQEKWSSTIRHEVVKWMVEDTSDANIYAFYEQACRLNQRGLLSDQVFIGLFYQLFSQALYH